MDGTALILTVFFEDPFWVGVFERYEGGQLSVCKVTFGAEPSGQQIYDLILHRNRHLCFGPELAAELRAEARSLKRRQRQAARLLAQNGTGTRAQQALAAQREQNRQERGQAARQRRAEEQQRRFEQKQQKKKQKHKGR